MGDSLHSPADCQLDSACIMRGKWRKKRMRRLKRKRRDACKIQVNSRPHVEPTKPIHSSDCTSGKVNRPWLERALVVNSVIMSKVFQNRLMVFTNQTYKKKKKKKKSTCVDTTA